MSESAPIRRARHEATAIAYAAAADELIRRFAPLDEAEQRFHGWLLSEAIRAETDAARTGRCG